MPKVSFFVYLLVIATSCTDSRQSAVNRSTSRNESLEQPLDHATGEDPNRPKPQITITPEDLQTGIGDGPIEIRIFNLGNAVDEDLLSDLAASTRLIDENTEDEIAFDVDIENVTPKVVDGYRVFAPAIIRVKPCDSRPDRWQRLEIVRIPTRTRVAETAPIHRRGQGIAVRFLRASSPQVKAVQICPAGDNEKLVVETSEPMLTDQLEQSVRAVDRDCTLPSTRGTQVAIDMVSLRCKLKSRPISAVSEQLSDGTTATLKNEETASDLTIKLIHPVTARRSKRGLGERVFSISAKRFKQWGKCKRAIVGKPDKSSIIVPAELT